MAIVFTEKNRMDFASAKRFFNGLSFDEIKSSVASGCFKKVDINKVEDNVMDMNFGSLAVTFRNADKAEIDSYAEVYDENGNCLGTYNFDLEENSLPENWESLVTDDMLHDLLQKRNIQTIECLQLNDIPDEMKEEVVDEWFENAFTSDIADKIEIHSDVRRAIKDLVDCL